MNLSLILHSLKSWSGSSIFELHINPGGSMLKLEVTRSPALGSLVIEDQAGRFAYQYRTPLGHIGLSSRKQKFGEGYPWLLPVIHILVIKTWCMIWTIC